VSSAHQEIDSFVANQIHESMLLGDPSRPQVRTEVAQRFGLTDSLEGISDYGFDPSQDP
jgi:hypothetical protein